MYNAEYTHVCLLSIKNDFLTVSGALNKFIVTIC